VLPGRPNKLGRRDSADRRSLDDLTYNRNRNSKKQFKNKKKKKKKKNHEPLNALKPKCPSFQVPRPRKWGMGNAEYGMRRRRIRPDLDIVARVQAQVRGSWRMHSV
jgi:hypothetical protein